MHTYIFEINRVERKKEKERTNCHNDSMSLSWTAHLQLYVKLKKLTDHSTALGFKIGDMAPHMCCNSAGSGTSTVELYCLLAA